MYGWVSGGVPVCQWSGNMWEAGLMSVFAPS